LPVPPKCTPWTWPPSIVPLYELQFPSTQIMWAHSHLLPVANVYPCKQPESPYGCSVPSVEFDYLDIPLMQKHLPCLPWGSLCWPVWSCP
jgi:hypothetical protein